MHSIKKNAALGLIVMLLCLCTNMLWNTNIGDTLTEIAQILAMIVPLVIVYTAADFPVTGDKTYSLLDLYANVCLATSFAMLIQYAAYQYIHLPIGIIHSLGGRTSYYCLFKGASILPIYMGIGIIFIIISCFEDRITPIRLLKIGVIFLAAVLNSSRTALFALMVILAIIVLKYLVQRPSIKGIAIAIIGIVGSYLAIDYITALRSGLTGFLDTNNRTITWENGIRIWFANPKNFFLGEGFTGGRWTDITKPHNFVIQTLAQCGSIVSIIVFGMLLQFVWSCRKSAYVYILLFVILSCMLVTDFYANAFTTVVFMLVCLNGKANSGH